MFTWNGKSVSTNEDIMNCMNSIQTESEARSFLDAYRSVNSHAEENLGYLTGYFDSEKATALRKLFGVKHPVFGNRNPTP